MTILETPVVERGDVRFDQWMDETVTPGLVNFTAIVDGASRPVVAVAWGVLNELRVSFSGLPAVTDLRINLDVTDPNLRNTDGVVAVAPQSVFNTV